MTKTDIRKLIKNQLVANHEILQSESCRICEKIIDSDIYKNASTVIAYMALPDEVNLSLVIKNALANEKKVFLPHVYSNTNRMDFFQYTDSTATVTGEFNILEPEFTPDTPVFTPSNDTCLFLIPGRAFTKDGDRVGRGKGYYDIYLEPLKNNLNIKKAGICFPLQVLPEIPATPFDIKMDFLFY